LLEYDSGNIFNGIACSYSRPFLWQERDLYPAGATSLYVVGLCAFDKESIDSSRNKKKISLHHKILVVFLEAHKIIIGLP